MRTELQPLEETRKTFTATFVRFGLFKTRWGFYKKVLLKNITDTRGHRMAQHVSLSDPSDVRAFEGFGPGDILQFSAVVHSYVKGYHGESIELRLARPMGIDYGIHNVQEIKSLSNRSYPKKQVNVSLMQELNSRKRVSLGVC
jgi:hypothetical protein